MLPSGPNIWGHNLSAARTARLSVRSALERFLHPEEGVEAAELVRSLEKLEGKEPTAESALVAIRLAGASPEAIRKAVTHFLDVEAATFLQEEERVDREARPSSNHCEFLGLPKGTLFGKTGTRPFPSILSVHMDAP